MSRINVVTGAGSGIGKATAELLISRGETVIGVDIKGTEIIADLGTAEGRAQMVVDVTAASGGKIDAIIAVAGIQAPIPATVAINFFGAVATLNMLRPLMAGSEAPRAVAVSSMASLQPADSDLMDACIAEDEPKALELAKKLTDQGPQIGYGVYPSSKQALSRWIRLNSIKAEWAGADIPLNAVAPGVVISPMTAELLSTEEGRAMTFGAVPSPLGGASEAYDIAEALAFLASPANRRICGQTLFVDSGCDASMRGDSTW